MFNYCCKLVQHLSFRLGNIGCTNGQKFVLKPATGVMKQFMVLNDKASLAFVTNGKKFTACTAFLDITSLVRK